MNYNGPLHEMSQTTPTHYWNDSCSVEELKYAIERGAVGATSNPSIVLNVLKKEMYLWEDHIRQVIAEHPHWNETTVSWKIFEDIAVHGAKLLLPVFEREQGKCGRLSIQTDPANYRTPQAILEQAIHFSNLLPNMQVKVPATKAGLEIVEEATFLGVNLNVTVNFTVPQALAVGEAVERGLKRREAEGLDNSRMAPVNTMMIGRTDDWMKVLVKRDGYDVDAECLEWAGIACFKRAYAIYQERGYHCRMLSAAYRNFYHWTELIGGNVSLTIPHEWQVKYNSSNVKIESRMDLPVDEKIIQQLYRIPDFRRAYEPDGMTIEEFDGFGATVRTLRSFIEAWHNFVGVIRDLMLPNPDVK